MWDLWQQALDAAGSDNDLRSKIDRLCVQALGDQWITARDHKFDRAEALEQLRVIAVDEVPRITDVPEGVGRVHFESDLRDSKPISSDDPRLDNASVVSSLIT